MSNFVVRAEHRCFDMLAFRKTLKALNNAKLFHQCGNMSCNKKMCSLSKIYVNNQRIIHNNTDMEGKFTFNFNNYDCIGFDLDNTLARYKVGNLIEKEHDILARFLVDKKGFSREYLMKPLDHNFLIKGLIIDDENGNLLRIAPDGTIVQATHGTRWLNLEEISKYYPNRRWKPTDLFSEDPLQTWNGPYAEKMRTLLDYYDMVISLIFARAVDWIDSRGKRGTHGYNIWPDVLAGAVNMFARDHFQTNEGEFFAELKASPDKYYYKCSDNVLNWLSNLKRSGKRLFLITGSHIDFASHTAEHTLGPNWKDYFDIIVSYAKKPSFFTMKRDFIGLDGFKEIGPVAPKDLELGGSYTHGNWDELRKFLIKTSKVPNPKFLYVGDNLVQDIYTPHVHCHFDTVAVCEEMEAERTHGFTDTWHPDEHFLRSTIWGSYFHCKVTNSATNWYHMMKTHSRLGVPSVDYLAQYPIDYEFPAFIQEELSSC